MKKILALSVLSLVTLAGCGGGGDEPYTPSGPTGQRLDIDKATAMQNLFTLGVSEHFEISYTDFSLVDPVSRKFGSSGQNMCWDSDINEDLVVHELITNESENIVYDRYTKEKGASNFVKQTVDATVSSPTTFNNARETAMSKFLLAHILDEDQVYTKKGEAVVAGRECTIFDYDTEYKHERYWMDKTIGIALKIYEYHDAQKTTVSGGLIEVTSFVTGVSVITPGYK